MTFTEAIRACAGACGVYSIFNHLGDTYVGQSEDVGKRLCQHLHDLNGNVHPSPRLQFRWYASPATFQATILEVCSPAMLAIRERSWIKRIGKKNMILNEQASARIRGVARPKPFKAKPNVTLAPDALNIAERVAADTGRSVPELLEFLLERECVK